VSTDRLAPTSASPAPLGLSGPGHADPEHTAPVRLGPLIAVLVAGGVLSLLNTTVTGVAIPDIARSLHASIGDVQWVGTGYVLAVAVAIPVSGWAAIRYGTRAPWLVALTLFALGAAAAAVSWSLPALVGARVLQGLGGGMLEPLMLTAVATAAGPARMGKVMGIVAGTIGIGPLLGPLLGGIAVDGIGWRGLFVAFAVATAIVLAVSWRTLPQPMALDPEQALDRTGLALLSAGSIAILIGLSQWSTGGDVASIWVPVAVGVVVLAGFSRHAARLGERAVVDIAVLRGPAVVSATLVMLTLGLAIYPMFYGLPQFFQGVRGYGVLASGLLLAPQGAGSLVGMVLGGRLSDRVSPRLLVPAGAAAVGVGLVPYLVSGATAPIGLLVGASIVTGLGVGFIGGPTTSALYRVLAPREIPNGTTVLFVANQLGGAFGIAVLTALIARASGGAGTSGWTTGTMPFVLPVAAAVVIGIGAQRLPSAGK
jgi:EmrB/QacA subfamily drug resistance transporter